MAGRSVVIVPCPTSPAPRGGPLTPYRFLSIAGLPQALAEDVLAWKAEAPGSNPEAPLQPYRNKAGNVTRDRHHDDETARTLWQDFKRRHAIISDLTMAHLRHWVKRKGRRRFTDNLAMVNYWQGHKPEGGGMAGHYGTNLPVEDILEEQLREWPDGPLGDLLPPKVAHDPGCPRPWSRRGMP